MTGQTAARADEHGAAAGRRHAVLPTALGDITVVRDDDAILGLFFPRHRHMPPPEWLGRRVTGRERGGDGGFDEVARELAEYLDGRRRRFTVRTRADGSPFRRRVWELIAAIPRGETTTYGAIAAELGGANPREVGGAVGRNPLSIIIPCHRVVGSTGDLTGYAGGLDRKRRLLEIEGALPGSGQQTLEVDVR